MPSIVLLNSSNSIVYSIDKTNWTTQATGITGATDLEVDSAASQTYTLYASAKNSATYAWTSDLINWYSSTIAQTSIDFNVNSLIRMGSIVVTVPANANAVSVRLNKSSWLTNTGVHWITGYRSGSAKSDQFLFFPSSSVPANNSYYDCLRSSNNISQGGCVAGPWISSCWTGTAFLAAAKDTGAIQKGTGFTLAGAGTWASATSTAHTAGHHSIISNGTGIALAFPATATNSYSYSNNDGTSWSTQTLPSTVTLTYSKGDSKGFTLIPTGTTNFILYSIDGLTWETITVPTAVYKSVVIMTGKYSSVLNTSSTANVEILKKINQKRSCLSTSVVSATRIISRPIARAISTSTATFFGYNSTFKRTMTAISTNVSNFVWRPLFVHATAVSTSHGSWTTNKLYGNLWSIIYALGKFVGVKTASNTSAVSTTGNTWSANTLPSNHSWSSIASDGTNVVAVAKNTATSVSSTNGTSWTSHSLPTSRNWCSLTCKETDFVAVSLESSKCAKSSDGGSTWAEYDLPQFGNWTSIANDGTNFVAITDSIVAAYSTDGQTWTQVAMPSNLHYNCVTFANSQFTAVASGPTNQAAKSVDGTSWTAITMPSTANWTNVGPGVGDPSV